MMLFITGCGDDTDDYDLSYDDDDDDDDDDNDDLVEPEFYAGFAVSDVTPDVPVKMAGYGTYFLFESMLRWSEGIHDPLYAHAAAFSDPNGVEMILVVIDDVGTIINEIRLIREGIVEATGVDPGGVIVASTHTHHGPDTIGLWGIVLPPKTGRQEDVLTKIVEGAIEAGVEAWENMEPAILKYATGTEPDLHFNEVSDPNKSIDSTMTFLAAFDTQGALLGSIMNWACHPTVMGFDNTLISSDYPGAYYRHMDEDLGGINMFTNGAIGGSIQPAAPFSPWEGEGTTWDDVDEFGRILADDAIALLEKATPIEDPEFWLFENGEVDVKVENILFRLAFIFDLIPREVPPLGENGTSYFTTFALGSVTFATIPGEYVPNYSFDLRQIMGGDAQFVIGLGQDWIGYAIKPEQFTSIYYLYERLICPSREAGDELMTQYHAVWDSVVDK